MRSLPFIPLLILVLGAALSTNSSWAQPGSSQAAAEDEEVERKAGAKANEAKKPKATPADPAKQDAVETVDEKIVRLTKERDKFLAEMVALEEGYSDKTGADGEMTEAELEGWLTSTQVKVDELDAEIAALKAAQ